MTRYDSIHWTRIGHDSKPNELDCTGVFFNRIANNGPLVTFLQRAARGHHRILLIVNDSHRATPTHDVLKAMTAAMQPWNERPAFRVLVATGTHAFDEPEKRRFEKSTFGSCGLTIADIDWHESDNRDRLRAIGDVQMNHLLTEHEFILAIGSVEPHYFAGVTGAHKTLTIGCLSRDDIERNHARAMHPEANLMQLDGNPVFEGMQRVLADLLAGDRKVLAINTVSDGHHVVDAEVGHPIETVKELLPLVTRSFVHIIPSQVDIAHLIVPLPLGRNLYQADKAFKNCHGGVRTGGGLLLDAPCPGGIGNDSFLRLLRRTREFITARRIIDDEGYELGDHKAVRLLHLMDPTCRNLQVAVVSAHDMAGALHGSGVPVFSDRDTALESLADRITGPVVCGLRVQDAGNVCVTTRTFYV